MYSLATSIRKRYIIATNSYIKYCAFFKKRPFFAQVRGLAAWIGHLRGKKLKSKTIKRYLVGFQSLCLDCTLDMAELEVYSHPVLQKIIAGLRKLYKEGDTCKRQLITCDILLKLITRFDQTTFEDTNLYAAFCLAFVGFLRMGEFTYNKVKGNFNSRNLTQGSIFILEVQLLLVFPAFKTDLFCQGVTLTILVTNDKACAVKFFCNIFEWFSQVSLSSFIFYLS